VLCPVGFDEFVFESPLHNLATEIVL